MVHVYPPNAYCVPLGWLLVRGNVPFPLLPWGPLRRMTCPLPWMRVLRRNLRLMILKYPPALQSQAQSTPASLTINPVNLVPELVRYRQLPTAFQNQKNVEQITNSSFSDNGQVLAFHNPCQLCPIFLDSGRRPFAIQRLQRSRPLWIHRLNTHLGFGLGGFAWAHPASSRASGKGGAVWGEAGGLAVHSRWADGWIQQWELPGRWRWAPCSCQPHVAEFGRRRSDMLATKSFWGCVHWFVFPHAVVEWFAYLHVQGAWWAHSIERCFGVDGAERP